MCALPGLDHLQLLKALAVEAADHTRLANRHVESLQVGVVHDNVRHTWQRQRGEHLAVVAVEHDERAPVGRTEEPAGVEPESVRPVAGNIHRPYDRSAFAVDNDDLWWRLNVGIDDLAFGVANGPAWPSRQRELGDHGQ